MGAFIILVVTFGLMWVLFILPQQRRVKAQQALIATIGEGDEVMTTAGLFGTIVSVDDETVHLEVSPGVVLRFARGAIARRVDQPLSDADVEADALADADADLGEPVDEDTGLVEVSDEPAPPAVHQRRGLMRRRSSDNTE